MFFGYPPKKPGDGRHDANRAKGHGLKRKYDPKVINRKLREWHWWCSCGRKDYGWLPQYEAKAAHTRHLRDIARR